MSIIFTYYYWRRALTYVNHSCWATGVPPVLWPFATRAGGRCSLLKLSKFPLAFSDSYPLFSDSDLPLLTQSVSDLPISKSIQNRLNFTFNYLSRSILTVRYRLTAIFQFTSAFLAFLNFWVRLII